jgi:hypothetical protein
MGFCVLVCQEGFERMVRGMGDAAFLHGFEQGRLRLDGVG